MSCDRPCDLSLKTFAPYFVLYLGVLASGWALQLQTNHPCKVVWLVAEFWQMESAQMALDSILPPFWRGMWRRIKLYPKDEENNQGWGAT